MNLGQAKTPLGQLDVAAFERLPKAQGTSLTAAILEERQQGR
jgi:hypothetical protein